VLAFNYYPVPRKATLEAGGRIVMDAGCLNIAVKTAAYADNLT